MKNTPTPTTPDPAPFFPMLAVRALQADPVDLLPTVMRAAYVAPTFPLPSVDPDAWSDLYTPTARDRRADRPAAARRSFRSL